MEANDRDFEVSITEDDSGGDIIDRYRTFLLDQSSICPMGSITTIRPGTWLFCRSFFFFFFFFTIGFDFVFPDFLVANAWAKLNFKKCVHVKRRFYRFATANSEKKIEDIIYCSCPSNRSLYLQKFVTAYYRSDESQTFQAFLQQLDEVYGLPCIHER